MCSLNKFFFTLVV